MMDAGASAQISSIVISSFRMTFMSGLIEPASCTVIGKTVIIIYQQYHKLLPPSASASATITAFALLMHS